MDGSRGGRVREDVRNGSPMDSSRQQPMDSSSNRGGGNNASRDDGGRRGSREDGRGNQPPREDLPKEDRSSVKEEPRAGNTKVSAV